jgi:hypothetical protein
VPPFIVLFLQAVSFFAAESDFAVPGFSAHLTKKFSFPRDASPRIANSENAGSGDAARDVANSCEFDHSAAAKALSAW